MKKKKVGCCLAMAFVLAGLAYFSDFLLHPFGPEYGIVRNLDVTDPKVCSIVNKLLFEGESNQWIQLERCSLVKGKDATLYGSGRIPAGRLPSFTNTISAAFESVGKGRCVRFPNMAIPWYYFDEKELAGGWENLCTSFFILRESNSTVRIRFENRGGRNWEFPKEFWDIVNQSGKRKSGIFQK